MSRDFTLFQFDLDEATVRRVLSSIPGVTPLPPENADHVGTESAGEARSGRDDAADPGPTEPSRGTDDAAASGTESGAEGVSTMGDPREPAAGGRSTPWPGAPVDEDGPGEDEGLVAGFSTKQVLLAVGAVLGLGVIGVGIVWFFKRRGDEPSGADDEEPVRARTRGDRPDAGASEPDAEREAAAADAGDGESADDEESRSYPMDPSPVVGMAFLVVGTLVFRHFRSGEETDD